MENEKFVNGLMIKYPSENAPDFVKMKLSFKVEDFVKWLYTHQNNSGWVNIDVLLSKDGTKLYGAVNDFKAQKPNLEEVDNSSIPF